jgi:hypothetical protein
LCGNAEAYLLVVYSNGTHRLRADQQEKIMSSLKFFGAAVVLAALVAAPVSAQQAVQEPGAAAFYHPNADILNAGVPAPSSAFAAMRDSDLAATHMMVRPHRARHR